MKRTLASALIVGLVLSGCTNNPGDLTPTPTATPTAAPSVSEKASEPTEAPTTEPTSEPDTPEPTTQPEPEPAPSISVEAGTPATEFAARWGKRYPLVPEYAILKAANGVCVMIDQYPNWTNNPIAQAGINEIVTGFGLSENDAVEFAQDAQQNYCASRSNPT